MSSIWERSFPYNPLNVGGPVEKKMLLSYVEPLPNGGHAAPEPMDAAAADASEPKAAAQKTTAADAPTPEPGKENPEPAREADGTEEVPTGTKMSIAPDVYAMARTLKAKFVRGELPHIKNDKDLFLFASLHKLVGTSEPFASRLYDFWIGPDGPGFQSLKPLRCAQTIHKRQLDLKVLWDEVNKRGGYAMVKENKLWATVGKVFKPPQTCTNLSFIIRKCYQDSLLYLEEALRTNPGSVPGIALPEFDEKLIYRKNAKINVPGLILPHHTIKPGSPEYNDHLFTPTGRKQPKIGEEEIVGYYVRVYWREQRAWFEGTIVGYDGKKYERHQIKYTDGEVKWHRLEDEKFYCRPEKGSKDDDDSDEQRGTKRGRRTSGGPSPGGRRGGAKAPRALHFKTASGDQVDVSSSVTHVPTCGVTKVEAAADGGFEVFALLPGMTLDDVAVSCTPDGKVCIDAEPENAQAIEEVGLAPIHQVVTIPHRIDVARTTAILTLHGLLYVKVEREIPSEPQTTTTP